ncbi:MAG: hypothetical protein GY812_12960 [Actinomycetia bacterium]|nr:hypothetical protein [Actinomycetes bacterium]
MSTQVMDRVSEIQEQILEWIDSLKAPVSDTVGKVTKAVTERVDVPAVPFAEEIPTPKEVIDNQAKFASKLVTTNKGVALGAARAAAPLTDTLLDRKVPVKKAAAKKTKAAA